MVFMVTLSCSLHSTTAASGLPAGLSTKIFHENDVMFTVIYVVHVAFDDVLAWKDNDSNSTV